MCIRDRYRQRVSESGALRTAADFVPILGDALAAKEVYDETQKPDTNWALVGAVPLGLTVLPDHQFDSRGLDLHHRTT